MNQVEIEKRSNWVAASWTNRDSRLWAVWKHPAVFVRRSQFIRDLSKKKMELNKGYLASGAWPLAEQTWAIGYELA